ncbi:tripartite tricarboxylate transporter permease [Acuticoccus kandeliae]|uniref:tripartite tricarboxylate transporter permease n=1 Tax=Acuticoccus kandeliae TaxID=2073160 RepID=UPI000D3E0F47|nr:tripartite tricarboxylate transporter permease [Acuticoccus kandeliae]
METLGYVLGGFSVAFEPSNLLFLLIGTILGTVFGILPGIGATAGIALLLPITYGLDPTGSLIMLAGIYYGAMYGNTGSAVLINTPGSGTAVMTTLDGFPMAQAGRAGAALAISAIASFIAGTIGIVFLTLFAIPLASFALGFGPAEYFVLLVFAMTAVGVLAGDSVGKGMLSALIGLAIATVGIDLQSAQERFTLGIVWFQDGIPLLVVIVGFFAVTEVLVQVEKWFRGELKPIPIKGKLWLTRDEWRRSVGPITRGGLLGFFIGVLPGAGGVMATIIAYATEKRISKTPERFGKGAVEGVAAPEAANNAASCGAFVPLLTLGIPGSGPTAVLLGAFIMFGIQPGPQLLTERPELVWGLVDSMYLGNIFLLILNLPLIGVFARLLYMPPGILMPIILAIALTGVYAINGSVVDLYTVAAFGVIGYAFRKLGIPTAPLILGVILGSMMEQSFRQAMTISRGDLSIFVSSTICITLIALTVLSIFLPSAGALIRSRLSARRAAA